MVHCEFSISMDHHVKEKEEEKIDKYIDLAAEFGRQFKVKTVIVPIALGALKTVPAKLLESLEILEIENIIGGLQIAVLRTGLGLKQINRLNRRHYT